MSYDHSVITLSPHVTIAIMDAVQRTVVDKGASRATRRAAVSALLALVDAGLMVADLQIGKNAFPRTIRLTKPLDARPPARRSTLTASSEDDGRGIEGEHDDD
jgi:hypothetical protein